MFVDLEELKEYKIKDHFFFGSSKELEEACNVPKKTCGVYLVFELKNGRINLVYIGSGGKIKTDGSIKGKNKGLFDDIVNGEQFGDIRNKSWKKKLTAEGIDALDIYWYETYNREIQHIPSFVEGLLLQIHLHMYGELPKWNLES